MKVFMEAGRLRIFACGRTEKNSVSVYLVVMMKIRTSLSTHCLYHTEYCSREQRMGGYIVLLHLIGEIWYIIYDIFLN